MTLDDLRIKWSVRDHAEEEDTVSVFANIWLKADGPGVKPRACCEVLIPAEMVNWDESSGLITLATERLALDFDEMLAGGNPDLAKALGL